LWVGEDAAVDLDGVATGADAARRGGALGRIAAAGARGGADGSDHRVAEAAGDGGEAMSGAEARREELVALYKEVSKCTKCALHETRTKTVFGAGNADADLMFVGEAPGAEEDRQGLPFVGRAGQLLNEMLVEIGLSREDVFICNVLKSRPPNNRDPLPGEISACEPWLFEQVRLIEPRVVCTLGNFATKLLTGSPTGITRVRGVPQTHELGGRTVFMLPLFHPAAALRTPAVKEQLRADFATIPALLEQALPAPMPSAAEIAEAEGSAEEAPPPEPPPADQLGFFGEPGS
jgi:uracil-DNA glycosylase